MATPQATSLLNALRNIQRIGEMLDATNGALTITLFSTNGDILNRNLDYIRSAIGLEFASLVQNLSTIKSTDPIVMAYPDIHHNLKDHIARRNWLIHEYTTTIPIKWSEVAVSVYNDIPTMESGIIAALKALGLENPSSA